MQPVLKLASISVKFYILGNKSLPDPDRYRSKTSLHSQGAKSTTGSQIPQSKSLPTTESRSRPPSTTPNKKPKRSLSIKQRLSYLKENLLFATEFKYCKKHNDLQRMASLRQSLRSGKNPFARDANGNLPFERSTGVIRRKQQRDLELDEVDDQSLQRSRPLTPTQRSRPTTPTQRSRPASPEPTSKSTGFETQKQGRDVPMPRPRSTIFDADSAAQVEPDSPEAPAYSTESTKPLSRASSAHQLASYRERLVSAQQDIPSPQINTHQSRGVKSTTDL